MKGIVYMLQSKRFAKPGFSMMELMVYMAIVIVIISLLAPSLKRIFGKSELLQTKNTLTIVNHAVQEYRMDVHAYPQSLKDVDKRPEGVTGWSGSYLPEKLQGKEITDAWGQEIVYKLNPKGTTPPYQLYSLGDPSKDDERIYADD